MLCTGFSAFETVLFWTPTFEWWSMYCKGCIIYLECNVLKRLLLNKKHLYILHTTVVVKIDSAVTRKSVLPAGGFLLLWVGDMNGVMNMHFSGRLEDWWHSQKWRSADRPSPPNPPPPPLLTSSPSSSSSVNIYFGLQTSSISCRQFW